MPRDGSGPSIGLSHINAWPADGCSKPAMMRSNVDLPQPEAPIRQTNSPLAMVREASLSAWIVWSCSWKCLKTRLIWMMGTRASAIVVARAPAQQAVADRHHDAVGDVAREPDHDHAADDEVGARQRAGVHDDGAQALRHARHLADHDHEPCEAQAETQAGEDRR